MGIKQAVLPAFGEIEGSSLTGTFAAVITPTENVRVAHIFNTCNNTIEVSLDAGTTSHYKLDSGESFSIDFRSSGVELPTAAIHAKHSGAAPTSGSIRISVIT